MLLKCRFIRLGAKVVSKKNVYYRRQIQRVTEKFLKTLDSNQMFYCPTDALNYINCRLLKTH